LPADCFICRKHRGEVAVAGGLIYEDELLSSSHAWEWPGGLPTEVHLGHVFIETKRHAPYYSDLTDEEARAVGLLSARLSRALKEVLGVDFVFAAVIGTGVPHFHLHLLGRYPGTPPELDWFHVDEWEGAPRGDEQAVAEVVQRLRDALAG
jgi:diadenosine tetraphosphate (Ap4A) HIT family hydrolase